MFPLKFIEKIHNYEITLDEARNYQTELRILINKLNNDYNPRNPKKAKEKNNVLESARKLLDARKDIIGFFEKGTFPYKGNVFKIKEEKSEEESEDESEEESEEERVQEFIEYIENEPKGINYDLFKDYFKFVVPSALVKKLYEIKSKKKKNKLVNVIKSGLSDLKGRIKEMSEDEKKKKNEQPAKIIKIVEEMLEFNEQNQSGKGLKILTTNQMLSRLPILLAQLKAGNNSEKRKNEIRQIFYSLYRSKKLTKQLYKSLIDIILKWKQSL